MPTSLGGVVVPIDYSTRDYEGYRSDLLSLVPLLTPEWTDLYPADPGVVLIELFSYIGDNLSYYIDRAANECFLSTMTQRRSAIFLGRLVGYELQPATSAIVVMEFTCTGAGTIPTGTRVGTDPELTGESQVVYEVRTATVVGGAGTVDVECIQGESVLDEILGSGTGLPDQAFELSSHPLSYDPSGVSSLRVYVDEGSGFVLYQEAQNFLDSEPTDRHYIVRIDENDVVTIIFGNGVDGRVVAGGINNVKASYRTGGGIAGNQVGTGQITKLLDGLIFVSSVTNGANIPQGGQDKESVDDARENIPASIRALDRAVTHEDYETLAKMVAGVSQAKAAYGIGPFEEVVYVAAEGTNPIASGTWDPFLETGTGLIGQVGDYLRVRKAAPVRLMVRPPSPAPLEMQFSILVNDGFFQSDVEVDAENAIVDLASALRMGEEVVLSDYMGALEAIPGVNKVKFTQFRRQPTAVLTNPDPFLAGGGTPDTTWTVGTTDDINHDEFVLTSTLQPTLQEVLEVVFFSATQFRVRGDVTGRQSQTGTVGVLWTNDLGNLTLLATAGGTPDYAGVKYRITVGSGSVTTHIIVGEYEIATLDPADVTITEVTGGISG